MRIWNSRSISKMRGHLGILSRGARRSHLHCKRSHWQLWGKWIGEGRDGAGKVGDFCRNPGEGRQVTVTTRVLATKMNETTGWLCLQVGSIGLGDGVGVTEGGCRVSPGSCPELPSRSGSLEGGV